MNEYKRLTERDEYGNADIIGVDSSNWQFNLTFEELVKVTNALNTFAKLEDKIENGTLIELGYHIRKSYRNHDDQRYKIILIDEVEIDKIGYDGLTKAEAEVRLKELQEEQK